MPALSNVLASIPGYGGYLAKREMNEQAPLREAQQMGVLVQLQQQMQAQQQQAQLQKQFAESGGDVEKALAAAIQGGNLAGAAKLAPLVEARRRAKEGRIVSPGSQVLGPNNEVLHTAPFKPEKEPAGPEIVQLQNVIKGLPEGSPLRSQLQARIDRLTRDPPPPVNNVYSNSLVAGVDENGNPIFVQPSSRPGVPPRPVEGVYPPERPAAARAAREREEGEATANSVRNRIKRMTALIQGGGMAGGVVGPLGTASKIGETVAGAVTDVKTPAIDFENEQALLLSDVRKLVEKDPNLSKDERERLYQTLGGGFWQTPGSALRALNNVVEYVESKKMTGPSRQARIEGKNAPAIGTVDQGYRFKGGDPSKPESWERVK